MILHLQYVHDDKDGDGMEVVELTGDQGNHKKKYFIDKFIFFFTYNFTSFGFCTYYEPFFKTAM